MEKKTSDKILRRFQKLPLHHIDTSIVLEPEKTEDGRNCRRYLQKVGYNYRGKISFPALSELFITILRLTKYEDKRDLFDAIDKTIFVRKIEFCSPLDTCDTIEKIKGLDERVKSTDREIVACAVEDKAVVLVTLDANLTRNEKIEKEFGIEIRHPKELL